MCVVMQCLISVDREQGEAEQRGSDELPVTLDAGGSEFGNINLLEITDSLNSDCNNLTMNNIVHNISPAFL